MKAYKEMCSRAYVLTWPSSPIQRCTASSIYNHIHTFSKLK